MDKRKRIVICDDSLTIRKLLEMILVPAGYEVAVATTGQEAIALARRDAPDLMLLDYILPDMKGRDVCDALAANPRTAPVPVLIVSGKGAELGHVFKDTKSVIGFVHKPFHGEAVLEQVKRCLGATASESSPARVAIPALASTPVAGVSRADFERKEAVARGMFAVLRDQFARIPELMAQLGDQPAAMFFAKKFLTPQVIDALVAAAQPKPAAVAPAPGASPAPNAAPNPGHNAAVNNAELASLTQDMALLLADTCPTRSRGFSARMGQTSVPASQRAVLALIDGQHTFAQVVERSNLPVADVVRIVAANVRGGLLQLAKQAASNSVGRAECAPVVAVVSKDNDGLQRPLAEHLARRSRPFDTVPVGEGTAQDLADRLASRRPILILIDADQPCTNVADLCREIQKRRDLHATRVCLIASGLNPASADSGTFERTLQRPVRLQEIEELLIC